MFVLKLGKEVPVTKEVVIKAARYFDKHKKLKGCKIDKVEMELNNSWFYLKCYKGKKYVPYIVHLDEVIAYALGYRKMPQKAIEI